MAEGDAQGTESAHSNEQDKLEAAKSEADAWAAASAEVARLEQARLATERHLAEEALNKRCPLQPPWEVPPAGRRPLSSLLALVRSAPLPSHSFDAISVLL